jgi:membrane protein YdbS with pleckstrin-like domain
MRSRERGTVRQRGRALPVISILLVLWLIVGAFAAGQRHYFSNANANCASLGTIAVTMLAGPLNYVGVNPKIHCQVPKPSR